MKKFTQRALALILILALALLSGCAEDNIYLLSSATDSESSLNTQTSSFNSSLFESSEQTTVSDSSDLLGSLQGVTSANSTVGTAGKPSSSQTASKTENEVISISRPNKIFRGLWISYYELPFWGKSESEAKAKMLKMMKQAATQGYSAVFCHVRANADAFYPSKYFPFAKQLTGTAGKDPGYDPLKIMIWAAKKYSLEFHAWINPYRVSNTDKNPNSLASGHIAASWLTDGSERAVAHGNGIYFNPASTDAQKLILNGVREILDKYSVDGIHFDDYFYPEKIGAEFDAKHYAEYTKSTQNPLSLEDWRRANVNTLVSAVYKLCHSKNTLFGISPAGNMSLDNSHDNYNKLFVDIALWMAEEGYVDYILPQIYFGYNHPAEKSQYTYLLNVWTSLERHKKLKLYVGLGAYRMNEECDDKAEWHNEADLMARQATDAIKRGADGIAVFSYTATTLNTEHNGLQIKNMFNAINSFS